MVQSAVGNRRGVRSWLEFVVAVLEFVLHLLGKRQISAVSAVPLRQTIGYRSTKAGNQLEIAKGKDD